jgi:hypothetical protein
MEAGMTEQILDSVKSKYGAVGKFFIERPGYFVIFVSGAGVKAVAERLRIQRRGCGPECCS